MALPATDGFTGSGALSASWTTQLGSIVRFSDVAKAGGSGDNFVFWNADAFGNDQYAQGIFVLGGNWGGMCVRAKDTGAGMDTYYFSSDGSSWEIGEFIDGSQNTLSSGSATVANGSLLRLEVTGASPNISLVGKDDGATIGSASNETSLASGSAGFNIYNVGATCDDFEGGNIGGTAYALVCDGGSYALTGQALSPLRAAKVDATAGEYTLAGQDAGAYYGRAIDADGGVYALTGQDVTLPRTYKVITEAGVYSLTGQAIGALLGRLLSAGAGAYTLTGQDAALLRGFGIDADAGSYALTGQAIAALFGRKISADAGAYAWTGSDVTLIYTPGGGTYVLTCEGGVYAIAGADAGLLRDARIAADGEAYVVTGQDAATLLGRLLDAGAGAYAVTGTDAALLRAAKIAIDAGAYAVTGADAQLSYSVTVVSPNVILITPVERIKLLRPVERTKILRPVKRGPIDTEPGQDGAGWDAGTFTAPSAIGDDAGGF